jgi:Ca2+-binding RTX toxin-like protein
MVSFPTDDLEFTPMANDYTALLSGSNWGGIEVTGKPVFVTFSFPSAAPAYNAQINDPNLTPAAIASFSAFSAAEQALALQALGEWGSASGLTFIQVAPGQGDINIQKLNFTGTGYAGVGGIAYRPFGNWQFSSYPSFTSDLDSSGDVFMNSAVPLVYGTLLHEIGHALGLKHPTEAWTNYAASPPVVHTTWASDNPALTIMSQLGGGTGHLTPIDVQAIQSIYGTQAQDGKQVASWSWNAATQTLTHNGYATADVIRGTSVADVINGNNGDDKLFGLNGEDVLSGGAGNDLLDGGPGADTMKGGTGDDTYFVDTALDQVIDYSGAGYDTVITTVSFTLPYNIERLQVWGNAAVTVAGNSLDNAIFGNNAGDTINGLAGADYLVGGTGNDKIDGGTGADAMYGGLGDDSYKVDTIGDYVFERPNEGTDSVSASISFTLGADFEKLALSGTDNLDGAGNALANSLTGNAGNNTLSGLVGNDYLSGGLGNDILIGGLGIDTLWGGAGADRFRFDVLETSVKKDTVKDFVHGTDLIELSRSAFSALAGYAAGALNASELALGPSATLPGQHLVYNAATGALFYDDDGSGAHAKVQIAVFSTLPVLDAGDFVLI